MKKVLSLLLATGMILALCGCSKKAEKTEAKVEQTPVQEEKPADTFVKEAALYQLAEKYGFKVGGCISFNQVSKQSYLNLLKNDFNTITATNEFKAYSLLNQQKSMEENRPVMNYRQADAIAGFARENGIGIRGHVLVWDAYMSDWFFRDGFKSNGSYVAADEMELRLKYYIEEVITHFEQNYPGVVYCWDVVNEAVADGANEWIEGNEFHIRQTRGGSVNMFNEIMGPDYVKFAFKCARETVNKVNPDIKLFYNDYNTFYQDKRDAIIRLINHLNEEEKLCDGIGMQGYIGGYGSQEGCMNQNDLNLIKTAIKMYSDLGIEVQLTEVAVRNYDKAAMDRHAKFYGQLFKVIKDARISGNNFTGITIWGLIDNPTMPRNDYSYKMNGPYCGLYTEFYIPKDSYKEAYKVLAE